MFKLDDLFNIITYLKDNIDNNDPNISIISQSEKSKTIQLFENIIDQNCFNTNDYIRLREMFIDWYSAHKSLITIGRNISDIYSLPDLHLNELFYNFGYNLDLQYLDRSSKNNFFLDLVNLYKIKGTPVSILSALKYYGLDSLVLYEYWLKADITTNKLNFEGNISYSTNPIDFNFDTSKIFTFDEVIQDDPHWFLNKKDISIKNVTTEIALPSLSPYFSIDSINSLTDSDISLSILHDKVVDQYTEWLNTGIIQEKNVRFSIFNGLFTILDLYCSFNYIFNKYYSTQYTQIGIMPNSNLNYNGNINLDKSQVENYKNQLFYNNYETKEELLENINLYYSEFNQEFSTIISNIEGILSSVNPDLKILLDNEYNIDPTNFKLLKSLCLDITSWIRSNYDEKFGNLYQYIFGLNIDNLKDVINFFKPFRARLIDIANMYVSNDNVKDKLLITDQVNVEIILPFNIIGPTSIYTEGTFQYSADPSAPGKPPYTNWTITPA